jgi:hypothetical protein
MPELDRGRGRDRARRQGARDERVELRAAGGDGRERRPSRVVDLHLVPVGEADAEGLRGLGEHADVEAEPGLGVALQARRRDVDDGLRERVDRRDTLLESHRREAHVQAGAYGEPVGELPGDRGVHREALELGPCREVPPAEAVGILPPRLEPERHVEPDSHRPPRSEPLRVVERGNRQDAHVLLLDDAGAGERARALEVRGQPDQRPADVELPPAQEGDPGGVVEDGGGIGRLRGIGAREAHP